MQGLTATREANGDFRLSWHYRNLGDYDQNGIVGVSDLSLLAMRYKEAYGKEAQPDCIQAVIDGSGIGKVERFNRILRDETLLGAGNHLIPDSALIANLIHFLHFYNYDRPHSSLDWSSPALYLASNSCPGPAPEPRH